MHRIALFFLLACLTACETEQSAQSSDMADTAAQPAVASPSPDSLAVYQAELDSLTASVQAMPALPQASDSVYVSHLVPARLIGKYGVWMRGKEGMDALQAEDWGSFDTLAFDDETLITSLPAGLVDQYYETVLPARVDAYSIESAYLGTGQEAGYIYLSANLAEGVMKIYDLESAQSDYAIGNMQARLPAEATFPLQSDALDWKLRETLDLAPEQVEVMRHWRALGQIYSVAAVRPEGDEALTAVYTFRDGRFHYLHSQPKLWVPLRFKVLPLLYDGHPILLFEYGVPSSDVIYDVLLVHVDREYRMI